MVKKASGSQAPREKKKFDLPGQIRESPEENEPLRVFYESLYNQRPESDMAQIWMMEHGLLDEDEARKVLVIKNRRGPGGLAMARPTAAAAVSAASSRATGPTARSAAGAAASRSTAVAVGSKAAAGAAASRGASKSPAAGAKGGAEASRRKVESSSNGSGRSAEKKSTPTSGRKAIVKSYKEDSESEDELIPLKKLRR